MANSANPEINKKIATSALGTLFIATVFFYLGDRYAETLVTYPGQIFDHLGDAMLTMWETIGDAPFALDMTSNSLLFGGACFLIIWMIWLRYVAFIGRRKSASGRIQVGRAQAKKSEKFSAHTSKRIRVHPLPKFAGRLALAVQPSSSTARNSLFRPGLKVFRTVQIQVFNLTIRLFN